MHYKKSGYSKEVKSNIQKQITIIEQRIENLFKEKLDGIIEQEQYQKYNDKWQIEKDKLYMQLDELNKIDSRFYKQSDSLLDFTDNAYEYNL